MNNIIRNQPGLNVSGKKLPNIGGGWNTSRYNENDFIKKAKCIGIYFQHQNSGHNKALLIQHNITDAITTSLHNPTCHAAKDLVKYVSKYMIIKLGYYFSNLKFIQNKDFKFHENLLFETNDNIDFDKLKINKININRKMVLNYVKNSFLNTKKVDFEYLIKTINNTGDLV